MGNLTDAERREWAIRLNVERRHLSSRQRKELLESLLRADPARSEREVADLLRIDRSTVGRTRRGLVAGGAFAPPEFTRGRDGKRYRHPTVGVETPSQADEASRLLAELGDDAPEGVSSLRSLRTLAGEKRRREYADRLESDPLPRSIRIDCCDMRRWKAAKPDSTDLILADPPWLKDHAVLREPFAAFCARVLRPGGLVLFYTGHYHLPEWLNVMGERLSYRWLFAAVNDSGGTLMSVMKSRHIHNGWRPLALFSKGETRLDRVVKDVVLTECRDKSLHDWAQPLSESRYWVEMLCPVAGLVCDPFLGSGTVPTAVAMVGGRRRFLGCEIDPATVKIARRRVAEALAGQDEREDGPSRPAITARNR